MPDLEERPMPYALAERALRAARRGMRTHDAMTSMLHVINVPTTSWSKPRSCTVGWPSRRRPLRGEHGDVHRHLGGGSNWLQARPPLQ